MVVRLAVVGCGAISEMGHIPAILRLGAAQLLALVDSDRSRAERLAERFGVQRAVSDMGEIAGTVDAVILATPPHVRPVLAEQAANAGLHVLCEKPLANTGVEAQRIVSAVERASRVLSVAHTCRFFPNRVRVAELLQQQRLGRIVSVDVEQGGPYDWLTRTGYSMRQDAIKGGVMLNEGIHALDTLFWWFGSPQAYAYEDDATGGLESNARASIFFAGGVSARCRFSRTCTLDNRITIRGERGSISLAVYDYSEVSLQVGTHRETIQCGQEIRDFPDLVSAQVADFLDSIESRRAPRVNGEDGTRAVMFIEQCYAAKRARPVPATAPIPGLTW